MKIRCFSFFLIALLPLFSWAQEALYGVSVREAPVFSRASDEASVIGKIPRGRRLTLQTDFHPEFYKILSTGGKQGFVRTADIDLIESDEWGGEAYSSPAQTSEPRSSTFTFDLGASSGRVGRDNYMEFNLGLNWFFTSHWAWRNAVFYRVLSGQDDYYGWDSSVRYFHFFRWSQNSGLTFFGGPGVRVPSENDTLPFAEGGLVFRIGDFSFGGGAKGFFPGLSGSDQKSDTQFFIILSGSGSIF